MSGDIKLLDTAVAVEGRLGVGTDTPNREVDIVGAINVQGAGAGVSIGDRGQAGYVENPPNGERWELYATGGRLHFWSSGDRATITPQGAVYAYNFVVGPQAPMRAIDVNGAVHVRGDQSGISIGGREHADYVTNPANGERWELYSIGGKLRFWSSGDQTTISPEGVVSAYKFVIGVEEPSREIDIQGAMHVRGDQAGISIGDRAQVDYVANPGNGERWELYADGGKLRFWSSGDMATLSPEGVVSAYKFVIGVEEPNREIDIDGGVHVRGGGAGLSFANRDTPAYVDVPTHGERWEWYAVGGQAHLWSGGNKLSVSPSGHLTAQGMVTADAVRLPIPDGYPDTPGPFIRPRGTAAPPFGFSDLSDDVRHIDVAEELAWLKETVIALQAEVAKLKK